LKPFNPLLGETYEMEMEGMRYISEQVSHHPPVSSGHCETETWIFYGSAEIKTKFKGTYLKARPHGTWHVILKTTGDHFTWEKPTVDVYNIIVGSIYVDVQGIFHVQNINTKDTCEIDVKKSAGWFSKGNKEVFMTVTSGAGDVRYRLEGNWDRGMRCREEGTSEEEWMWEAHERPEGHEYYYFFTAFTLLLNVPVETLPTQPAPTDSRLRPDQRALENGDLDLAAAEKHRLEEK
jgi:hypothetical protein